MSEPFIGLILQFGGNFAPRGWAFCQGQLFLISQNTALYAILGTTYGGNGQTTFGLPDLRGRQIVGTGQGPGLSPYDLGEQAGTESQTLTTLTMPLHNHTAVFANNGSALNAIQAPATQQQAQATGSLLARGVDSAPNPDMIPRIYAPANTAGTQVTLSGLNVAGTVTLQPTGSNQPFATLNPFLAVSIIIAIEGIFPSRN